MHPRININVTMDEILYCRFFSGEIKICEGCFTYSVHLPISLDTLQMRNVPYPANSTQRMMTLPINLKRDSHFILLEEDEYDFFFNHLIVTLYVLKCRHNDQKIISFLQSWKIKIERIDITSALNQPKFDCNIPLFT